MKPIIFVLFLLSSSLTAPALAQTALGPYPKTPYPASDPRVAQLDTALNQVQQEQQALYQQFQMTQELRRNEMQDPSTTMQNPYITGGLMDNPPQSYDENIRSQRERRERIQQYTRDLNRLYVRYNELGKQKRVLMDQLMELTRTLRSEQ